MGYEDDLRSAARSGLLGGGVDTQCTADGGAAAAETVVGDRRVVGVIGTSCSVAAFEALTDKAGFAGIIGSISCDGFGDCGAGVWE